MGGHVGGEFLLEGVDVFYCVWCCVLDFIFVDYGLRWRWEDCVDGYLVGVGKCVWEDPGQDEKAGSDVHFFTWMGVLHRILEWVI